MIDGKLEVDAEVEVYLDEDDLRNATGKVFTDCSLVSADPFPFFDYTGKAVSLFLKDRNEVIRVLLDGDGTIHCFAH